jgi:hypothetical protein
MSATMKMNSALFFIMIGLCMLFTIKELTFTIPLLSHGIALHLPRLIGIFFIGFGMDTAFRYGPKSIAADLSSSIIILLGEAIDTINEWPSNVYFRLLILGVYIIIFWLFLVFWGEVAKSCNLSSIIKLERGFTILQLGIYGFVILFINLFQHLISHIYSPALFLLTVGPL